MEIVTVLARILGALVMLFLFGLAATILLVLGILLWACTSSRNSSAAGDSP